MREPEWLPIETAPKDGSFIIVSGGPPHEPQFVAQWVGKRWLMPMKPGLTQPSDYPRPTHWLSMLTAPPADWPERPTRN